MFFSFHYAGLTHIFVKFYPKYFLFFNVTVDDVLKFSISKCL